MSSFDIIKKAAPPQSSKPMNFDTVIKNKQNIQNAALKGHILNNNIKKDKQQEDSFDYIIQSSPDNTVLSQEKLPQESAFDVKKAIKPIAIVTGATVLGIIGLSACITKYSNYLANNESVVRPPDLPRSMNILEEYHLAMYRALRDPSKLNILGLAAVGAFSALTLSAKTLVDSAKEIWIKKQNCDIDYDLQANLIEVEKNAFSGKLNVVNTLLNDSANYFRNSLDENKQDIEFKQFLSFKGKNKEEKQDKKKINPIIVGIAAVGAFCSVALLTYSSYQKTGENLKTFIEKAVDGEIREKIANAQSQEEKVQAIDALTNIFKSISGLTEKDAKAKLKGIKGLSDEEAESIIEKLKYEHKHMFAQAPEALGGVAEKVQYYCYINEERGHLYNWILNPENKWNKYLFLSFCLVSSIGYMARSAADAIKQVTVSRENSKSELNLRKRLVGIEIDNFKAKKLSAINPMIENYNYQKKKGKSKEELTTLAQNILLEIKNGPPYIYN
ncbi:MAG: hypothetical protein IJ877_02225 [Candidatus Gastranaerophilales bacterium]|nr:hypothetical protein [Candidatus Gastranaerophilales bacterium]